MLVLFVELQDLQNAGAGALQLRLGLRIARGRGRDGAQGFERGVEAGEERALALKQSDVGGALVETEETVFFERALVQVVAELVVGVERFRLGHGRAAVLDGAAGAGG